MRVWYPQDTGCFFWLVPPQKVLSVEDGKIPTKKVKVGLFNSKMLSFNSDFHFFGRDLPSSTLRTFWGGTFRKKHPVEIWFAQKSGNMVYLEQRNPDAKQGRQLQRCSCSVPLRLWEGEEVGRVARIQPPTKLVVAQFRIHLATPWTFLSTFWGFFEDLWCNVASDLLLRPGPD